MIKCLYSSVSRWKVNMGENADTTPTLCPSLCPPFLSIQLWVHCVCECVWLNRCAALCMYLHVCVCVQCSPTRGWREKALNSVCKAATSSDCGTMQSDCAVSASVCVVMSSCLVCKCLGKEGGALIFGLCVPLGSLWLVGCSIFGIGGGFTNHSA